MTSSTLIIVEDEAIVAADLEEKLTLLGYRVLATAADGDTAISLARTHKPDLVLMDVHLRGAIDGITAAEQIRALCGIPVVFLTAHSDPRTLERAKVAEPFGYIVKPFEERELHIVLEIALHKHKNERELRASEQRYRSLFDYNLDAIFSLDAQGQFVTANPTAERLSGYTLEELRQLHFLELCPPELREEAKYMFREAFCLRCRDIESAMIRKDGERRDLYITGGPVVVDGDVVGVSCLVRDITEHKKMHDKLVEADRKKDEFIAVLAHELRNPLAPIRNAVTLLMHDGPEENRLNWCYDVIERQLGRMGRLLDDLLDVSRIAYNKVVLKKERTSVSSIFEQAVEAVRPFIAKQNHTLSVTLLPEPVWLDADPLRLVQVLSNLLDNAAKYSPGNGNIEVAAKLCGSEIAISVKDSGIGIEANYLPHVFEMFSQLPPALGQSCGGLGIGLSLSKALIELHGGRISAYSEGSGLGSEFVIYLPLAETLPSALPTQSEKIPALQTKSYRILIADDYPDARESLAMLLETFGYEVRVAGDGMEAIQTAEEFRPDIAVLDIGMPELDGYEVCRAIRKQPWGEKAILIALTGWAQEKDRRKSQQSGFDYHLAKPVDTEYLRALLAKLNLPHPSP